MSLRKTPNKPRRLHKGLLFFALACILLWGSMGLAGRSSAARNTQQHIYDLDGAAWQGIDQVEIQGLSESGQIVLGGAERPRLISRNDAPEQPRLVLARQGNTLIIRPRPATAAEAKVEEGTRQNWRTQVRIASLFLPAGIRQITGTQSLSVRIARTEQAQPASAAASTAAPRTLHLQGENIYFSGDIAHLRVQLHPRASAKTCTAYRGWAAELSVNSRHIGQLEIAAPEHSKIELDMAQAQLQAQGQGAGQLPVVKLSAGANTRLELQPLALLGQIQQTTPHTNETGDESACAKASSTNTAAESELDDYSD